MGWARGALVWFVLVVLVGGAVLAVVYRPRALGPEEMLADFRFMCELLRDNHPHLPLKPRLEGYSWLGREAEFEGWIRACRSDQDFAQAISRILLLVNDGHTGVIGGEHVRFLQQSAPRPWQDALRRTTPEVAEAWRRLAAAPQASAPVAAVAAYLGGSYVLVETHPSHQALLGGWVREVGGVPVDEYVQSLRGTQHLPYDPVHGKLYTRTLDLPPGPVVLEDDRGGRMQVWLSVDGPRPVERFVPGPRYTDTSTNVIAAIITGGQAGYIHIRRMSADERDVPALRAAAELVKGLPVLIIDIRGNGGGSDRYWNQLLAALMAEPLTWEFTQLLRDGGYTKRFAETLAPVVPLDELFTDLEPAAWDGLPPEVLAGMYTHGFHFRGTAAVPTDSLRYGGHIYLLTDDRTYSSADGFASFCRSTGWATLVGTPTGGGGTGGTPIGVALPNSGLVFLMHLSMGLNADGTSREETHTMPHILVEMTPAELLALAEVRGGPDPEHDAVLRACLRAAGVGW